MKRPILSAVAVAACAVLVLALGEFLRPLLTCTAGCGGAP